jgi:hypothetical protein
MTDGKPAADLFRLIGAQADVVRTICTFNENPADYIDPSRRDEFFRMPLDAALWSNARSRRHLSRHILDRMETSSCLEVQRPEWPLALLDRPRLDRLARHVAAALVGSRVRRSLSRDEVLKWRDWLSPEAHEFALQRAGLLPISIDTRMGASIDAGRTAAQELGLRWIVATTRRWPEAIARRFMLKLPGGEFAEADAVDGAFASRLVTSVLSIVESRWCSSFATMRI